MGNITINYENEDDVCDQVAEDLSPHVPATADAISGVVWAMVRALQRGESPEQIKKLIDAGGDVIAPASAAELAETIAATLAANDLSSVSITLRRSDEKTCLMTPREFAFWLAGRMNALGHRGV